MQKKIIQCLDEPSTGFEKGVTIFLILLVYVSIAQLAIDVRYPELVFSNMTAFLACEYFVLGIFTIEVGIRMIFDPNRWQYFKRFSGIVDLLAIVPGLLAIFLPFFDSTAWLRVLRLFRLFRIFKLIHYGEIAGGITQALTPFFAIAVGLKGIMIAVEGQGWWPEMNNLNVVIGVVGFSLAILLGAKLQVINSRLYSIEDAVCRIVGAMRDMQNNREIFSDLCDWAYELEFSLIYSGQDKPDLIRRMRLKTDDLEKNLEEAGVGGPNTAGFHRDVAYLLHRTLARTPPSYEKFLRTVVCTYTAVVIATVPGLVGFFATFLLVYVLGGLFIIIDDMDRPLDFSPESLIAVRLDPLTQFNNKSK
jgi:hypothetical protein